MCVYVCDYTLSLSFSQSQATVLKEVVAVADYSGQFEDELSFHKGDKISVILESESHLALL